MKLPSVYANKIEEKVDHNSSYYRTGVSEKKKNIADLLSHFDASGYVNRLPVVLVTKNEKVDDKLVLYKDNYLITIHNKKILVDDVIDYDIIK